MVQPIPVSAGSTAEASSAGCQMWTSCWPTKIYCRVALVADWRVDKCEAGRSGAPISKVRKLESSCGFIQFLISRHFSAHKAGLSRAILQEYLFTKAKQNHVIALKASQASQQGAWEGRGTALTWLTAVKSTANTETHFHDFWHSRPPASFEPATQPQIVSTPSSTKSKASMVASCWCWVRARL